ncbi:hypothetical protein Cob_v001126 [Colletotrichum orbiculare MAFF 240422]|uniref:Uncharacterized protein n=1 Tax=Colletotrichum orbiculare (strain 104-T / ATCC 96160 / CBS 514.97 / LARS 414 / MAFF 240422) TaxID=1213857 RepID=A0A484G741_COLOR|nr:hypothetical protein Cob_v001126 [Colletotrichum orbiculare MAFF 240422]
MSRRTGLSMAFPGGIVATENRPLNRNHHLTGIIHGWAILSPMLSRHSAFFHTSVKADILCISGSTDRGGRRKRFWHQGPIIYFTRGAEVLAGLRSPDNRNAVRSSSDGPAALGGGAAPAPASPAAGTGECDML